MPDSSSNPTTATISAPERDAKSGGGGGGGGSRIDLGDVTQHNIKLLRKVNQVVFPVVYRDNFYKDVLEAGELAKLAYYNDIVVGAVCCRVDVFPPSETASNNPSRKLYIMTLGCLAPYRRLGIGTTMVKHLLGIVEKDGNFDAMFLHVQVNNESAIDFYRNFGFDIVETKKNYYKRIEPTDAYVLEKKLDRRGSLTTTTAVVNGAARD